MSRMPDTFTLTEEHITLLRASYVETEHSTYETGAAWLNPKRPYGNSDVAGDVIDLLGWATRSDPDEEFYGGTEVTDEEWRDKALAIHRETSAALQIVLSTGAFEPGEYRRPDRYNTQRWLKIEPATKTCPRCEGEGQVSEGNYAAQQESHECPLCGGDGTAPT